MKKILLIVTIIGSLFVGGCEQTDGPSTKGYFIDYTKTFRQSYDNLDTQLDRFNSEGIYDISSIDEVEETYTYMGDKEVFNSATSKTEFFNDKTAVNANAYIAETNTNHTLKVKSPKENIDEKYTSQILKWDNDYYAYLTVETINRNDKVEKHYDASNKEYGTDAFKDIYPSQYGSGYLDRKYRVCLYSSSIIEKNEGNVEYIRREQAYFLYNSDFCLEKYHYYDEIVTNKDIETGELYNNKRVVSYHYHEIDYHYKEKRKQREIKELNANYGDIPFFLDVELTKCEANYDAHYGVHEGTYMSSPLTYEETIETYWRRHYHFVVSFNEYSNQSVPPNYAAKMVFNVNYMIGGHEEMMEYTISLFDYIDYFESNEFVVAGFYYMICTSDPHYESIVIFDVTLTLDGERPSLTVDKVEIINNIEYGKDGQR